MCKNLKIKFIITIIAIMFLALVIPSITNKCLARARGSENFKDGLWKGNNASSGNTRWESAVREGNVHISSTFFKKNYVFCIQRGQEIHFSDGFPEYTISDLYEIDGGTNGVLNGFAYILNSDNTFNRSLMDNSWGDRYAWTWYQDDPVQLAVWAYVKKYGGLLNIGLGLNDTQTGFPNIKNCDITINDTDKRIYAENPNGKEHTPGKYDDNGDGVESSLEAYKLYSYAVDLMNGTASDTNAYSANIRILTHNAKWKDNNGNTHSEYQRLMLVESTSYEKRGSISLRIYKQDNFGDSLAGAKIKITKDDNIKTMKINSTSYEELSLTSRDGDGCFVIDNNNGYKSIKIIPNDTNQYSVKLKLNEIEAPDGYTKLIDEITITIKFKKNNDGLIINEMTVDPNNNITSGIGDDGIGRIYIKNQSHVIEDGLEIIKTDTSGNNVLANAEFQFYFCWAKSVTLNGNTYTLDDISTNGRKIENAGGVFSSENGVYYEYKKDNLIFIRPENEKDELRPIMYIQKLKTDNSGKIIFDKIITTDSSSNRVLVTVTETSAPKGYQCLGANNPIYLELKINESGDGWQLIERTDKTNDDEIKSYFTLDKNNLTLKLKNDLAIDELKLLKIDTTTNQKLEGAKFEITAKNVSGINSTPYTTGTDGVISLKKLTITDPTKEIELTIKETEAAENHYLMSPNPVKITLKRKKDSNDYDISGTHAKYASCKDGVITIELKDDSKKVSGLNIKKVDKTGKYNVKDAEFQLFFNQIESIKFVGDDKTYTLAEIRKKPTVSVGDGDYMSNGSVYKMRTTGGYTLISPIRDDGDADRLFIEGLKTNAAGEINSIEYVVASEENKTIYFNIKETKTSSGWAILPGTVRLLLHYDSTSHKWGTYKKTEENLKKFNQKLDKSYYNSELDDYVDINEDNLNITLKDDYKIDKFSIVKTDSQTDETIIGSKFTVTLSNIKSATGLKINSSGNTPFEDIPGNTVFKDLVIKDPNESVVITIEETKAPRGYKRMEGKIRITLTRDGSTFKINKVETIGTVLEKEFVKDNATYSNNSLTVLIKNIPIMNLGGIVWEADQEGIKINPTIGTTINDSRLSGIEVKLYKNGNPVTEDMYGDSLMTKTAGKNAILKYETIAKGQSGELKLEEGQYIFPNLERGVDYTIEFTYDGINYKTIDCSNKVYNYNNESKVTEVDRDVFNGKFKTISDSNKTDTDSNSYSKANGIENYDMKYEYEESENHKTSNLITMEDGNLIECYKMKAISSNYLQKANDWGDTWTQEGKINTEHYALDINCGLLEKYFDLSLGSEIIKTKYTINGKELIEECADGATNVNRDINPSDYYYRYDDMIESDKLLHGDEATRRSDFLKADTEFEVYVTYELGVENCSIHDCEEVQVKYSYPETQELVVEELEKTGIKYENNGNNITITVDNLKNGETRNIEITLKLKKTGESRDLPKEIAGNIGLICENTAEIISYTTAEGGLVDNNSAPSNYLDNRKEINSLRENDETCTSVKFKLNEEVRVIQGNVAEADTEGNLNGSNINDVIVQLIEVFKNPSTDKYLEYIWQETKTGSNFIKIRDNDGSLFECELDGELEDGQYKFLGYMAKTGEDKGVNVGFIPGNYIIRFIYGDGTTYDLNPDVEKYNGQEYKSAVDSHYKEEWYNQENYKGKSTARDNEARKLEVMAFSTVIDGKLGIALDTLNKTYNNFSEKEKELLKEYYNYLDKESVEVKYVYKAYKKIPLNDEVTIPDNLGDEDIYNLVKYYISYKTWMCAETSKINVGIGSTEFTNVNFGLVERPNTKLVLEKHITSLKITPQGVGVQPIVEARLDIDKILDGVSGADVASKDATGITTELSIIKSTRDERGFWKVETDIEELAQGAKVELEYTYVIKNEGDEDYLSSAVIGEYTNNIGKDIDSDGTDDYVEYLNEASKTAKSNIKGQRNNFGNYLGQYYYTGEKGPNDASVLSTVTKIEDNLNNNLKFVNETEPSFKKVNQEPENKNVYDADGIEATEDIETVLENIESFATLTIVGKESDDIKSTDTSKTAKLETTLAATKEGIRIPTYLEEITEYTNAVGRKDMESTPGNLSYVHSEDTNKTMNTDNEEDEFWGETIIVSKPTGEDKQTPVQAIIIATTAIATIGVGIILIKKFVLKK